MIRLTEMNEMEIEQFERRIKKGFYQKGVHILYHEGDFSNEVSLGKLGALISGLAGVVEINGRKVVNDSKSFVRLFQKKISDEPRKYCYMAVVK